MHFGVSQRCQDTSARMTRWTTASGSSPAVGSGHNTVARVAALQALLDSTLDSTTRGIPLGETVRLGDIGDRGWNIARGDLCLPVTTLRGDAVTHNIATMAEYCRRHDALFAPHGKTTMAPQLFGRQLDAGAWAITAATPTQAFVMRKFGVPRILIANEVTDPHTLRWAHAEMQGDPDFELYFLVDNATAVAAADATLAACRGSVTMKVFLEVGVPGGRTGVRSEQQAIAVAAAVAKSEHLQLVGLETYEGLVTGGGSPADIAALDAHFARVRELVATLDIRGLFDSTETVLISAGGSTYFDRVTANLSDWGARYPRPVRLILRSGCYLSHDLGTYHELSPLDGRRTAAEPLTLRNALEAWATVLSTPEPGVAILGSGKRDVAYDLSLPVPLRVHHRDGTVTTLLDSGSEIYQLMDQHAFLRTPDSIVITSGDIVAMGLSHPCTAFDKCRLVPIIDDELTVTDAVITFF
jgi:D-serine dehydratase